MTVMNEDVTAATATPMRELVAEEIRALLGRRKMSGSELARRMGVSQKYMSRRITGETAFDVDDLYAIAQMLGVDVAGLLPRPAEGRLITTIQPGAETGRVSNERKMLRAERTGPNGHPKRTSPKDTTRRPVRLSPAHTLTVSGGRIPMRTDREQGVTYGA